ncbi:palmitoyltransferase ZDHHC16-like [Argonauta hians]
MKVLRWRINICRWATNFRISFKTTCDFIKLMFFSLCYNAFTSPSLAMETAMEPVFWLVDRFAKYMGRILMFVVFFLCSIGIAIFYIIMIPRYISYGWHWFLPNFTFGNWLLVNTIFNYVMGFRTNPGRPPQVVPEVVSICKRCIAPKPPRAHHCSICRHCILRMDHHCPWLNNCVGFYNHRYFFLYMVYMMCGCLYACFIFYPLFYDNFYVGKEVFFHGALYPLNMAYQFWTSKKKSYTYIAISNGTSVKRTPSTQAFNQLSYIDQIYHHSIIFVFFLGSGVVVALGILSLWHARLISRGETSIEYHINKNEKKRLKKLGQTYVNPYDFGFIQNWKLFLGLTEGRTFWRHILFPSRHKPQGNGLQWETTTFTVDKFEDIHVL